MRILSPSLCLILVATATHGAEPEALPAAPPASAVARAETMLGRLQAGAFAEVVADFDATMAAAMPADELASTWSRLLEQTGKLARVDERRTLDKDGATIVDLLCTFESGPLVVRIVYGKEGKVSGFWLVPRDKAIGTVEAPREDPDYVDGATFDEREVTIGEDPWAVPGTMAMPRAAKGRVAAVLLLAGSGPNDRDETLGPNKPLRDIARGLASRGIATLRYDKRTLVHGARMVGGDGRVTVREEVIDDALAALAMLRATDGIDPARLFVAGHSLGGMLVPTVTAEDGHVAGMILLSAAARGLVRTMKEQLDYLAKLPAKPAAEIAEIRRIIGEIDRLVAGELPADARVLGMDRAYLDDLTARDVVGAAGRTKAPALIVQGGRDYQVTMEDFAVWKKAFGARATCVALPDLNHLYQPGEGRSRPEEYQQARAVDARVIDAAADFVRAASSRR